MLRFHHNKNGWLNIAYIRFFFWLPQFLSFFLIFLVANHTSNDTSKANITMKKNKVVC